MENRERKLRAAIRRVNRFRKWFKERVPTKQVNLNIFIRKLDKGGLACAVRPSNPKPIPFCGTVGCVMGWFKYRYCPEVLKKSSGAINMSSHFGMDLYEEYINVFGYRDAIDRATYEAKGDKAAALERIDRHLTKMKAEIALLKTLPVHQ